MTTNGTDRLDSWKEIAEFIGRDKRTAMRWANKQGMPIRRVPGGMRGRVYASRAEISQWLDTHQNRPTETPHPVGRFSTRTKRMVLGLTSSMIVLSLVLVMAGSRVYRPLPVRVTFVDDRIQALDGQGRTIWTHRFEGQLTAESVADAGPLDNLVRIADLFGDGDREILLVAPLRRGPNPDDRAKVEVDCFSSRGKLLWSYLPQENFQFGNYRISGRWTVLDVLVSAEGPKSSIWAAVNDHTWGNSFVAQLDPATGHSSVRFVNAGVIYNLGEVKTSQATYLLMGGFNNEYNAGSLAVLDERKPFGVSPQTRGSQDECVSCPSGEVDRYFVFPRTEINELLEIREDYVRSMVSHGDEVDVSKQELSHFGGVRTLYTFRTAPAFEPIALRYDSSYDALHLDLEKQGKLHHSLDNCPERRHPKPVRLWTPSAGWTEINLPPMRPSD